MVAVGLIFFKCLNQQTGWKAQLWNGVWPPRARTHRHTYTPLSVYSCNREVGCRVEAERWYIPPCFPGQLSVSVWFKSSFVLHKPPHWMEFNSVHHFISFLCHFSRQIIQWRYCRCDSPLCARDRWLIYRFTSIRHDWRWGVSGAVFTVGERSACWCTLWPF